MMVSRVSEDDGQNWMAFSEILLNRDNPSMWVGRGG
jgi:hypothetical protein